MRSLFAGSRARHSHLRRLCLLTAAVFALTAGSARSLHAQQAQSLRVAAAADLQPVLPAIARQFEQQHHVHVALSFGASGTLTTQIENGAPFDLFLAADMNYPQRLIQHGLAGRDPDQTSAAPIRPRLYARGTLVLWARKDSRAQPLSLDVLKQASLDRLAIANPETAPYGRAAKAALNAMGVSRQIAPRLVVAENIAQAAQYAETGAADAGLISLNAANSEPLRSEGSWIAVPADLYPPLEQGGVILRRANDPRLAATFLDAVAAAMLPGGAAAVPGVRP